MCPFIKVRNTITFIPTTQRLKFLFLLGEHLCKGDRRSISVSSLTNSCGERENKDNLRNRSEEWYSILLVIWKAAQLLLEAEQECKIEIYLCLFLHFPVIPFFFDTADVMSSGEFEKFKNCFNLVSLEHVSSN